MCLLNSVSNRNWMANSYLLLHFPSWIRTIFKRRRARMCLRCACHSPPLSLCILTSKQLCWDNSYYCLLFFMIGFHIQYDLLITVLRTSKGHLPHPISITVNERQPQQQEKERKKKKKKRFHCILDGSGWLMAGGQLASVLTDEAYSGRREHTDQCQHT